MDHMVVRIDESDGSLDTAARGRLRAIMVRHRARRICGQRYQVLAGEEGRLTRSLREAEIPFAWERDDSSGDHHYEEHGCLVG